MLVLCSEHGAVQPLSGEFSMSLDSDVIVDRRRIRRKLTFWRVAAVVVAVAAVVAVGVVAIPSERSPLTTAGSIARVQIDGLIRSDADRVEALERLENSRAAAVIVSGLTAMPQSMAHTTRCTRILPSSTATSATCAAKLPKDSCTATPRARP